MINVKMRYLILLLAAFIFAYLNGGNLPYSIFYAFLLMVLFGFFHALTQNITLKVDVNLEKDIYSAGDRESLYIILDSFSFIPASYMLVKNESVADFRKNYDGDALIFERDKEKFVSNELEFKIRGIYDFSITDVIFTDLFSIFKIRRRFIKNKEVKIYPRVYEINEKIFDGKNLMQNSTRVISTAEESNDVRDLRRYIIGDNLKKVHWKVSAKHNELYVKNFSDITSKDASIFINMFDEETFHESIELTEELMIDFSASLINHLLRKNLKTKVFINNSDEKQFIINNREKYGFLMEYFLINKSEGTKSFSEFINSKSRQLDEGCWIGIITIKVNSSLKQKAAALINLGFKVTVFYCIDEKNSFSENETGGMVEYIKCDKAICSHNE